MSNREEDARYERDSESRYAMQRMADALERIAAAVETLAALATREIDSAN